MFSNPTVRDHPRKWANGRDIMGQTLHQVQTNYSTMYDNGLFDSRELGYIY